MSCSKFHGDALVSRAHGGHQHYHSPYASSYHWGPSNSPGRDVTDHSKSPAEKAKELGIMISKPKHPEYAVKASRLRTFENWPTYLQQRPAELVEAGFFYSGKGDSVFCFYCGQGLHSWEPEDVPWVEHAKWYPECVFLLNVKGKEFVEMVRLGQTDSSLMATGSFGSLGRKEFNHFEVVESKPKYDPFETPAVQSLVMNGYKNEDIKKAVEIWIKMKGSRDFSASDILQVIFELEDGSIRYEDYVTDEGEGPAHSGRQNQSNQDDQQKNYENQLREENKSLRDALLCKICGEREVCVVFLPCGHVCCCEVCAPAMKHCPSCQQFVKGTVKTYLV